MKYIFYISMGFTIGSTSGTSGTMAWVYNKRWLPEPCEDTDKVEEGEEGYNKYLGLAIYIIEKYTWVIIIILIILLIIDWLGWGINSIQCMDKDRIVIQADNVRMSLNGGNRLVDGLVSIGAARVALDFSKQFTSRGGKLASMGFVSTVVSGTYFWLSRINSVKNECENIESIMRYKNILFDISDMNSLLLIGMGILLNIFIVLMIKGKEDKVVNYLPFIKKGSIWEKWLHRYIRIWIKGAMFSFMLTWISIYWVLLVMKYVIINSII